ncbi:MAG: hypothetical protein KJ852_00145 [Gammaproteobacteria bacterium]|nr:hypothetical protein [Gammaproteobacteria bacterium]MBU0787960.1 hypothetical protein [Gammaproteobacteria bacterium]MBU0815542.1 hypothetical protein [Gammaproteobacteria bacterium]MBU1785350.1 hypothetical protein [Gammaproteobacteria bacterium]
MSSKTSRMVAVVMAFAVVTAVGNWIWRDAYAPGQHARELVRKQLKYPAQVQFDALRQDPDSQAFCGLLKTRDDSGQYVRRSSFVIIKSGQVWMEPSDTQENSLAKTERLNARNKPVYLALLTHFCPGFNPQITL